MSALAPAMEIARHVQPLRVAGAVSAVRGMTVLVDELPVPVGTQVEVETGAGKSIGEVIGFTREHAIVMMLGQTLDVRPGAMVIAQQASQVALVGGSMLGRVLNALGEPLDGAPRPLGGVARSITPPPIQPLERGRIHKQLLTGVRAIDLMTPVGRGQRVGVFAGPGVGKSTLLGQIARRTEADVNVIALIGERGREVRDFLEQSLGPEGLSRSVVVVATGDESPLMRVQGARFAHAIAEHFRALGRDVLFVMDSITRFAHAQRQIGLSAGEPPTSKGYTPGVFAQMALLLERAGALRTGGSITGFYTILVEGDDMSEPVSDAARGILDGHIVLSRRLAQKSHYPAIDILDSVSRVGDDIVTPEHAAARRQVARMAAVYREVEELVRIGAYVRGTSPESDAAIDSARAIESMLRQGGDEHEPFEQSLSTLRRIALESAETTRRTSKVRK